MSRTLSTKCGSLESLNVSERCGCKPKAPQMRQIVVCERPLSSAIEDIMTSPAIGEGAVGEIAVHRILES